MAAAAAAGSADAVTAAAAAAANTTSAAAAETAAASTAAPTAAGGDDGGVAGLVFDNRSLRELPLDPVADNYVRTVRGAIFSRVAPTPVEAPRLVVASAPALALLGLTPAAASGAAGAAYFSGNTVLPGAEPAAHCYCGHQFGSFAGQLGDGATMYLGEVVTRAGGRVELQFKGAGKTPYSRTADGRKVLRSSLREFLCSEAMWALGVPTTRAGTVVTSDSRVQRDIHYTGDVVDERATVITRMAPTFLRFGSFEIFKTRDESTGRMGPSVGNAELARTLADFTARHYYPAVAAAHPGAGADAAAARCLGMYEEVARRTARLAATWQMYGWCHGVLNTDNMSMVGVTIDYGPFGWMERTDDDFVCNTSDNSGRYSYHNQPHAVRWNVGKLGEALAPLLPGGEWKVVMKVFDREFRWAYEELARRKLGLPARPGAVPHGPPCATGALGDLPYPPAAAVVATAPRVAHLDAAAEGGVVEDVADTPLAVDDAVLVRDLLGVMQEAGADFTNTFRALAAVVPGAPHPPPDAADAALEAVLAEGASAAEVADLYRPRIPTAQLQQLLMLAHSNPRYAAHLDELAEEQARQARYAELSRRSDADKAAADRLAWRAWLGRYRERLAAADMTPAAAAARAAEMPLANPKYVLRNWLAQQAIAKAEAGDYTEVAALAARLADPYGLHDDAAVADASMRTVSGTTAAVAAVAAVSGGGSGGGGGGGDGGGGACGAAPAAAAACSGTMFSYTSRPPSWARDIRVS